MMKNKNGIVSVGCGAVSRLDGAPPRDAAAAVHGDDAMRVCSATELQPPVRSLPDFLF